MTFWEAIQQGIATREAIENLLVQAFDRYADDKFFSGADIFIGGKVYRFEDAIKLRAKDFLDAKYFDPTKKEPEERELQQTQEPNNSPKVYHKKRGCK